MIDAKPGNANAGTGKVETAGMQAGASASAYSTVNRPGSGTSHEAGPVGNAGANPGAVLSSEEIRLLAEIGFMACGAGHTRAAYQLFEGLRNLRPQKPFAYIGLALSRLEAGEPAEAVRILREEGLRNNPDDEELKVFLGLALSAARQASESERILREVTLDNDSDAPEIRMARRLLGRPASAEGDHDGT